jgi:hypothetical protein
MLLNGNYSTISSTAVRGEQAVHVLDASVN